MFLFFLWTEFRSLALADECDFMKAALRCATIKRTCWTWKVLTTLSALFLFVHCSYEEGSFCAWPDRWIIKMVIGFWGNLFSICIFAYFFSFFFPQIPIPSIVFCIIQTELSGEYWCLFTDICFRLNRNSIWSTLAITLLLIPGIPWAGRLYYTKSNRSLIGCYK